MPNGNSASSGRTNQVKKLVFLHVVMDPKKLHISSIIASRWADPMLKVIENNELAISQK